VVVVGAAPAAAASAGDLDRALLEALGRLSPSAAAAEVARALNAPKRALYARAIALKDRSLGDGS
jgi:16S rRNA (cytidine1402-2'-O)-methyltransferase